MESCVVVSIKPINFLENIKCANYVEKIHRNKLINCETKSCNDDE